MTTIKNKRLLYMYYNIMKYNFDLSAPPPPKYAFALI